MGASGEAAAAAGGRGETGSASSLESCASSPPEAEEGGDQDDLDEEGGLEEGCGESLWEGEERAAFGDLLDEYPVEELLLVTMAPFREKHLWFETQLDRIQVRT